MVNFLQEACFAYGLIADYKRRPEMNTAFSHALKAAGGAAREAKIIGTNNDWFCKWLGPLFTGLYIATMSHEVLSGEISLGKFLATASIFGKVSGDFGDLYKQFIEVHQSGP